MISRLFSLALLSALCLPSAAFAADDEVRVCVDDPAGLVIKTGLLDGTGCPSLATPHEVVGVWAFWTQGVSKFADEYSGHELFGCFDDSDGEITIQQRDTSGPDKGAKRKTYKPNSAPPTGLVDLPDAVADTASAGQVQLVVLNGGSGGPYNSKLATCRTLVGYPPI